MSFTCCFVMTALYAARPARRTTWMSGTSLNKSGHDDWCVVRHGFISPAERRGWPPHKAGHDGRVGLAGGPSAAHPGLAPVVERALLVLPGAWTVLLRDVLELGRPFDLVAVGILDHEEQVVAGAVAPGAPPQLDVQGRQMVRPVADVVPARGLVTVMVRPRLRRAERGEAVMLVVRAQERGGHVAIGGAAFVDVIGGEEAELPLIELDHPLEVGGGDHDMLQPRRHAGRRLVARRHGVPGIGKPE